MTTSETIPFGLYAAARFAEKAQPLMLALGRMESRALRQEIEATPIAQPVYITGLARAGSTLLLEMLAAQPGAAAHRYADFPFVHIPFLWNAMLRRLPRGNMTPKERPHQDGIFIAPGSPEAMEEMIWAAFFPHLHDPARDNTLNAATQHEAFERYYRDHIRKLLIARNAARYVAKNNYNVTRLPYLHRVFPDAKFILSVREPVSHVASLLRQHANFTARAEADPRVAHYLRIARHFEFGPDTRFIHTGGETPPRHPGMEARLWGRYWSSVYRHVHETLQTHPALAQRVMIVRQEDFCAEPHAVILKILDFCGFPGGAAQAAVWAPRVRAPSPRQITLTVAEKQAILAETETTGRFFGYA